VVLRRADRITFVLSVAFCHTREALKVLCYITLWEWLMMIIKKKRQTHR